jgi:hypothetical protein
LAAFDPRLAQDFLNRANEQAARQYMACYAAGSDKIELTEIEFDEYLVKTGRSGAGLWHEEPLVEEAEKALAESA